MRALIGIVLPLDEATDRPTEPPPPPDDPLVGEVVGGRYIVVRKERDDVETAVYLAAHTRVKGSVVHIHVLTPELRASKADRTRFRGTWELHALFEAERDHILHVEDIWSDERLGDLVATETLSGYRLDEWLARSTSPPPLDKAIEWIRQLATVVDVMHAEGLTHGDLRSEILYLANVGPHQIVKLTSFGTRRNVRQISKLGPGRYRAPEHALSGVPVGTKADVWSFGILAYELLSGRRFWHVDGDTSTPSDAEVESYLVERAGLVRGISARTLEPWMRVCLRRDPSERFTSVMEAWQSLHNAIVSARRRHTPTPRPISRAESPTEGPLPGSAPPGAAAPPRLTFGDAKVMRADKNTVWGLCVSPDGRSVFTVGDEGVLREWDPTTGSLLRELPSGHSGPVRCVAIAPDGRTLITGGRDRSVVIRDLHDDRRELVRSVQHRSVVTSVHIAPGGAWMLSTSEDGSAIVWDLVHDRLLWATPPGHKSLHAAVIARDQDTFITGGRDGALRRWSVRGQRCLDTTEAHQGDIYALALSPDAQTLVSCGRDGQIFEWVRSQKTRAFRGPRDMVTSVAFDATGRLIATGSSDPDVRVWDVDSGECLHTLTEDEWVVRAVAFDPKGRYLCSTGSGGDLRVWPLGA